MPDLTKLPPGCKLIDSPERVRTQRMDDKDLTKHYMRIANYTWACLSDPPILFVSLFAWVLSLHSWT